MLQYRVPVLASAVTLAALAVWGLLMPRAYVMSAVLSAVAAVSALWMLVLEPRAAKARAAHNCPAYLALCGNSTLTVSPDGITLTGDCVFSYDFARMPVMLEAPDMLVLAVDTRRFVVCPLRALDDMQLHTLRHACARKTRRVK